MDGDVICMTQTVCRTLVDSTGHCVVIYTHRVEDPLPVRGEHFEQGRLLHDRHNPLYRRHRDLAVLLLLDRLIQPVAILCVWVCMQQTDVMSWANIRRPMSNGCDRDA